MYNFFTYGKKKTIFCYKNYSGTSCTYSSTSCSCFLANGSAFCSMHPSSATTSTGMIHHNLTIGSHAQRCFSQQPYDRLPEILTSLSPFLRYRCIPLYSQVHEPPGDVWRRPLRPHLHHECRHIEQVPGARLLKWFNQLSCSELFLVERRVD